MNLSKNDLNTVLNSAIDLTGGETTYANTVRISVRTHEVFIDLYRLVPNSNNIENLEAERVQRIVMPLAVAKEFAEILIGGVHHWEGMYGINLPLKPGTLEEEEG